MVCFGANNILKLGNQMNSAKKVFYKKPSDIQVGNSLILEQGALILPYKSMEHLHIDKGSLFSKTLGIVIHLTHHQPKNLTKILILYLTGQFFSWIKYRYMLCNCTLNEDILLPFSTKNLHVKKRIKIFVKFLGQWWVK